MVLSDLIVKTSSKREPCQAIERTTANETELCPAIEIFSLEKCWVDKDLEENKEKNVAKIEALVGLKAQRVC